MAFITWNDSLSVKIDSIDEQHKKLIEMINNFYDNVSKQSNDELISSLIKGMKTYTIMHFTTEERYMKQFNYPKYEQHKKEHDAFISKVNDLEQKLKSGKAILSFEITTFLKDWIKKHIQEEDKQYTSLFLKNDLL